MEEGCRERGSLYACCVGDSLDLDRGGGMCVWCGGVGVVMRD